ncbi:MAG: cytochrome C oxidase subunit II [Mariprofundaceae bacterium]
MQDLAWAISLWLMVLLALAFVYVAVKSGDKADTAKVMSTAGKVRTALFWIILVAGVPVTMVTLADLPYAAQSTGAVQVVKAEGSQFSWDISPAQIVAGQQVEFHVTAADATHGFAIYDDSMTLLAQTQAMPEYTNVLSYTFEKAGTYKVLCLEYCGTGHHVMTEEISVVAAGGN